MRKYVRGGGQNKLKAHIKKKYLLFLVVGITCCLGVSYALFSETLIGKKQYRIHSNGLRIYLTEENSDNPITLENAIPVTDLQGKKNAVYNFSLVNEESQDLEYTIYIKEEEQERKTPATAIRYYYTRDINTIEVTRNMTDCMTEDGKYVLERDSIASGKTYQYTFQMWIDYNAGNEILNTKYSVHLEIEAMQTSGVYKEVVLRGTDPVLSDNLIPVTIGDSGTVRCANLYEEWYKYEDKKWANAVVLRDKSKTYEAGQMIKEEDIESYFVWIPRYKYKIFNTGNYVGVTEISDTASQTIEIIFEDKDTPISDGTEKGERLSHPAFQAFNSNGFWVGKFESGYSGATTTTDAEINVGDSSKLVIKPNVYSWRNITVGNAFKTSYDYLRSDESHMMKNTEWGAVAYLQHSIYGSSASVRVNNNSSYLTGYAGIEEPTVGHILNNESTPGNLNGVTADVTLAYNTSIGCLASTTGNISGVYDMSGGAWEYMMAYNMGIGVSGKASEITSLYPDFFLNSGWNRYYDRYDIENNDFRYDKGLFGDAIREMGPFGNEEEPTSLIRIVNSWYMDLVVFVDTINVWFSRGGSWYYGAQSGIFTSGADTGRNASHASFRITLAP